MEMSGELLKSEPNRYACGIRLIDSYYIGRVVSNKKEFEVTDNHENLIYHSKYKCDSFFQKLFTYGYFDFLDKKNNTIFQLHKYGFLKILTKLKTPNGFECRITIKNKLSLPILGISIALEGTDFKTVIDNKEYIPIAICLSFFLWSMKQFWDHSG